MRTRAPSLVAPAVAWGVAWAAAWALSGCTLLPVEHGPPPEGYPEGSLPETGDLFPNWPLPPEEIEKLILSEDDPVWESEVDAGAGTTGAMKIEVRFRDSGRLIPFKWKPMEGAWKPIYGRLDGVNNSPRKELAAWKIQALLLDPEDYVVPFSVAYCVPIDEGRASATPTLPDTNCELGLASVWMQDVTLPDPLLDSERFNRDYTYAYFLANLNLLTYVVKHHDGRPGNFLVARNDARRQAFAIDNGVAFGGIFYNWFVDNWNSIRVPALRKESIDRLRKLTEDDFHELLGVMTQLELDDEGVYHDAPPGENLDDDDGIRIEGKVLQLGLTEDEIQDIWDRIEDLIEDVDEGEIAVF
jgi:hypothetical protein